ncbi:unnamed protein product [Bursaphelenchus okinawaensis]|uniref:Uncharacterized protein n=1 Tax=Bursaphelenchus okinawaensis TaxID=465554 RepID=A0A811KZB6_9BILA|nr:unnamed protein product [Bursaphelenchus okinawaensis]CAG9115024.1 unnamed protein product [Bursaphelenchus okinawaensis]
MNGRLQSVLRSPLMRNNQLNHIENGVKHHHRRRDSNGLPRIVQFDESADEYRCFCSCLHIKTGTLVIAGIEFFLILFFFINSFLVSLQQKDSYNYKHGDRTTDYVHVAFIITAVCSVISTLCVLMMVIGALKNVGSLLIPHMIIQVLTILTLGLLIILGIVAVSTDLAICYRVFNAAPFHEHPQQSTVALDTNTMLRVYFVLGMEILTFVLEIYFLLVIYNCQQYFVERRQYMKYCMAYSKPMETLNSAR